LPGLRFVDFTVREPAFLDKGCPYPCRLSSLPGSKAVNSTTAISTMVFVEFSVVFLARDRSVGVARTATVAPESAMIQIPP
jgi:hypothetical protein